MPTTPVGDLLVHGLDEAVVSRLGQRFASVESAAAMASRHEAGQCNDLVEDPDSQPCPWHVPWLLAGDLDAVNRTVNAWMLGGWVQRGLFERRGVADEGSV